ncbi:hypothetical protein H0H93_007522 [Arthromyces matolae]|nr:hypothetical protein H0H93_007522 [Arthromyces matolae]
MWAKLTNVLKPRAPNEDPEPSGEGVMNKVFEQHPNLSVFHNNTERTSSPSPPPSPTRSTKSTKRSMFKRLSKAHLKDDTESDRPSPLVGNPKKLKSPTINDSQASILSAETTRPPPGRKLSFDMLRPSTDASARQPATISAGTSLCRPSLDLLRSNQDASPSEPSPMTPSSDLRFGSVRSILRDPKTPGTGQNVRFFSRDAYKVISPDQSMEAEFQSFLPSPNEQPSSAISQESFLTPQSMSPPLSGTFPITRGSASNKSSRPSVAQLFSANSSETPPQAPPGEQAQFIESTNFMSPIPPPDFNDPDISQSLDLPKMPPGLGFDVPEPTLDNAVDMMIDDGPGDVDAFKRVVAATSTPFRDKGKGKAVDSHSDEAHMETPITPSDGAIFHSLNKSTRISPGLHDRSHSFSFGQTVFHSVNGASPSTNVVPNFSAANTSSDLQASVFDKEGSRSPPTRASKSRSRALSDTVFQSMIQASQQPPEADINDESFKVLAVDSDPRPQPDPFHTNARTYYTPQTLIPVTPPPGAPRHARKTSKEDSVIFSLQTQLALQTELCQQYENDLRSRDELVEILGKKLGDVEKEDVKRRSILRTWKKKVQELEKTCRYLEEEVEDSRQSSMERSIMDEASGEALRMLHRQISVLEREKAEWAVKEETLRGQVDKLERNQDAEKHQESSRSRDESQQEFKDDLREASKQMRQISNEEEKEVRSEWEEEKAAIMDKLRHLEADLENTQLQLQTRDEEFAVLKSELDAQWENTEKSSEKIAALKDKSVALEEDRDNLARNFEELKGKMSTMEIEAQDSDARRAEVEVQLQEAWDYKEVLEREKAELEDQLQQEREHSDNLTRALQEHEDHISQLAEERQFAQDDVARLEEKVRQRAEEEENSSQLVRQRDAEVEQLREEMSNLRREHTHAIDELNRALEEASSQQAAARTQVETLVRQQATFDVETKSSVDKINALKEEIERQRRRIQTLQQESADKEVKLAQLTKQHQRDKEDLEGMNTALDSKQMELELIKRNLGVKGTAGATPAPASRVALSRRDSAIFSTPTVSRPPSSASEAGSVASKRRVSVDAPTSAIKVTALGKSIRSNVGSTISSSTPAKRIDGSMGPPPPKMRPSLSSGGTPTPRVSSLSRSSSSRQLSPATPSVSMRRVPSLEQNKSQATIKKSTLRPINPSPVPSLSGQELEEEKENVDVSSKRKSLIPTPA